MKRHPRPGKNPPPPLRRRRLFGLARPLSFSARRRRENERLPPLANPNRPPPPLLPNFHGICLLRCVSARSRDFVRWGRRRGKPTSSERGVRKRRRKAKGKKSGEEAAAAGTRRKSRPAPSFQKKKLSFSSSPLPLSLQTPLRSLAPLSPLPFRVSTLDQPNKKTPGTANRRNGI